MGPCECRGARLSRFGAVRGRPQWARETPWGTLCRPPPPNSSCSEGHVDKQGQHQGSCNNPSTTCGGWGGGGGHTTPPPFK